MAERVEMALQAILDRTGSADLPAPQSRNEILLHAIADMIAELPTFEIISNSEIDTIVEA